MMFATSVAEVLRAFASIADVIILGDVTYGACCIDDFAARAAGAEFLVRTMFWNQQQNGDQRWLCEFSHSRSRCRSLSLLFFSPSPVHKNTGTLRPQLPCADHHYKNPVAVCVCRDRHWQRASNCNHSKECPKDGETRTCEFMPFVSHYYQHPTKSTLVLFSVFFKFFFGCVFVFVFVSIFCGCCCCLYWWKVEIQEALQVAFEWRYTLCAVSFVYVIVHGVTFFMVRSWVQSSSWAHCMPPKKH